MAEKGEQKPETMEEFYKKIVDEMRGEVAEMRKQNHEMLMKYMDLAIHLKEVRSMTQRSFGINPETEEADERALDETLERKNNDQTFINGVLSNVYRGRAVSIKQQANRSIFLYFENYNTGLHNPDYKGTKAYLSEESFLLILEAMEFAAKKFGIDRKAIAKSLTGTDEPIEFKNVISHL